MKITSEKKGIFSHYIHMIWTKTFNEGHFHYNGVDVSIKVLVINKSKDMYY